MQVLDYDQRRQRKVKQRSSDEDVVQYFEVGLTDYFNNFSDNPEGTHWGLMSEILPHLSIGGTDWKG